MARPRKRRTVAQTPQVVYFKPRGVPMHLLREVAVTVEAVEAMRLVDAEGLTMAQAAAHMHISRHTLGRIVRGARAAVADALASGKALRIEGGAFALAQAARVAENNHTLAGGQHATCSCGHSIQQPRRP